jgi:hypothetical protein
MENDRNELIKRRAYTIWESEGRPDGKHDDHWRRAAEEMHGLEDLPGKGRQPVHIAPAGRKDAKSSSLAR